MGRVSVSALTLLAGFFAVVMACSDSQKPLGQGDDLITDVDASPGPNPQQGDDAAEGYDASVFAPVEGGYPPAPDGYSPYAICQQCGCPSGTFCFGGGTGYETFNGDCHADAGLLAEGGLSIGCFPIPAACEGTDAACDCLIQTVSGYMPCYPDCVDTTNIVYCPHP